MKATYVPIDGRPLRVSMSTRPLDLADWIEVDDHRVAELTEKQRLLAIQPDDVLAWLPRGDAGSAETLDLLLDYLPDRFPDVYERTHEGVVDLQRDVHVKRDARHPIDIAGQLVQEDLCLMSCDDGRWLLTAASLCFPSRWRLADKVGGDLSEIHGPVPFYEERIAGAVQTFFDRLTPDRPIWRLNWTLLDDPALFQPEAATRWRDVDLEGRDLGDVLHFRVERQTLRALPRSGDVLFTIRTYVRPMGELESVRPGAFADLANTLETTPGPTIDYKGWAPLREATIAWLRAHS